MKLLIKQYEVDNNKKQKENESLLEKVNRLIKINNDLINAKQDEFDKKDQEKKVVVEVRVERGTSQIF